MKPFRERNPVLVGAVSLAALALLLVGAFRADSLPIIGGGETYYAQFSEAGGLQPEDEVRIAGVRVGKVTDVELDDGLVKVAMKVDTDHPFGDQTRATIKVKTLLGSMFVAMEPAGEGQLPEDGVIPVERTQSPYDVIDAFSDLAGTADAIDTEQLGAALTTMADLTRNTPESFRAALDGMSALSKNLAAKDERINTLLQNLDRVTAVLGERDEDIVALMKDADLLFRALVQRRQAVHDLLVSTTTLAQELSALIEQSRADLAPALAKMNRVLGVLTKNEENLDNSLRLMAPFYRVFANVLGNGPWFDSYIENMPPAPGVG